MPIDWMKTCEKQRKRVVEKAISQLRNLPVVEMHLNGARRAATI